MTRDETGMENKFGSGIGYQNKILVGVRLGTGPLKPFFSDKVICGHKISAIQFFSVQYFLFPLLVYLNIWARKARKGCLSKGIKHSDICLTYNFCHHDSRWYQLIMMVYRIKK